MKITEKQRQVAAASVQTTKSADLRQRLRGMGLRQHQAHDLVRDARRKVFKERKNKKEN
jgi:hypothetical protein